MSKQLLRYSLVALPLLLSRWPAAAQIRTASAVNEVARAPYLDASLPLEQRVNDLVSRMTLEEKVSQMEDVAAAVPRLGIPAYNWWNEGLHGVARSGNATVFPQAIGLAATWDTGLIHRVADVISTEARAKYNDAIQHGNTGRYFGLTFWSPNINIFRDPRWGRGQETYGEDPYLSSRIGVAFVTGLQGDDPSYLKTVSTSKHYAVHSGPEVLRHRFNVPVSPHDLADTYTPAFRATILEGRADSVMCAYNSVRGEPACANHFLFDTLRNKWGFRGYVVSDCWAISDLHQGHGFVLTLEQAAALAVKAGTDLSCGPEFGALPFAVKNRLLANEDIDRAVKRLFEARFRLGMFDPPERVPWSKLSIADNDTPAHRQLALEAAHKSMVLLKNDRNTLPLKSSVKTIAVIGPNADSLPVLLGNYNGNPSSYTTILEGLRKRFRNAKILTALGSPVTETSAVILPSEYLRTGGRNSQPGLNGEYFANVNLAGSAVLKRTDANVDFEWNNVSPGPGVPAGNYSVRWTGELVPPVDGDYRLGGSTDGGYRIYLDGKKFVDDSGPHGARTMTTLVHLQAGHAYPIRMEYLHTWWEALGGVMGRRAAPPLTRDAASRGRGGVPALADFLPGDYNPPGGLRVIFYQSVVQPPPFGNYSMAGRTYRYFTEPPLYPFGYGLSFSSFSYSDAKVSPAQVAADGTVTVSVGVTNTSSLPGDEVVQLYLAHPGVDGAPIRALAGFRRIRLDAAASETVNFPLRARDLSIVDEAGVRRIVPGAVEVWIGAGQPVDAPGQRPTKGLQTRFTITSSATLDD